MKAWTITQLYLAMQNDLKMCHTELERSLCATINKQGIREQAEEFRKNRKLTPSEESILASI